MTVVLLFTDHVGRAISLQASDCADSGAGGGTRGDLGGATLEPPDTSGGAMDELGRWCRSFNRMTEQLGEGREQINEFTRNLEQVVEDSASGGES